GRGVLRRVPAVRRPVPLPRLHPPARGRLRRQGRGRPPLDQCPPLPQLRRDVRGLGRGLSPRTPPRATTPLPVTRARSQPKLSLFAFLSRQPGFSIFPP